MKRSATKGHPAQTSADPEKQNEGEGSRSAARRYNAGATQMAKDAKQVEESGKKADKALEGPQGDELRDAETRAKRGPVARR